MADHWVHERALSDYAVAGLAGHLARAVLTADRYLDGPEAMGEPIGSAEYVAVVLASHDPVASGFHTSARPLPPVGRTGPLPTGSRSSMS